MSSKQIPLFFIDLDDTIFQTKRKMACMDGALSAAVDSEGKPHSFMRPEQAIWVNWMLQHADVVPVTARSVAAFQRVVLPFQQGAICCHGAVILDEAGQVDPIWHQEVYSRLLPYQSILKHGYEQVHTLAQSLGLQLRIWLPEEEHLVHYLAIKQTSGRDTDLSFIRAEIARQQWFSGFEIHQNGNNLAYLPNTLNKRFAVAYWLEQDRLRNGRRPVLGWGDSWNDFGFLGLCDWWGAPIYSQITDKLQQRSLDDERGAQ